MKISEKPRKRWSSSFARSDNLYSLSCFDIIYHYYCYYDHDYDYDYYIFLVRRIK